MARSSAHRNREESPSRQKTRVRRKRVGGLDHCGGEDFQRRRLRDLDANLFDKGEIRELPGI